MVSGGFFAADAARLLGVSSAHVFGDQHSGVDGVATINLRIVEGVTGAYRFQFSVGQVRSEKSEPFELFNVVFIFSVAMVSRCSRCRVLISRFGMRLGRPLAYLSAD